MNLDRSRTANADINLSRGIDLQMKVVELGPQFWGKILAWTNERNMIIPREQISLGTCAAMPDRIPTLQQCKSAMKVLERAKERGFSVEAWVILDWVRAIVYYGWIKLYLKFWDLTMHLNFPPPAYIILGTNWETKHYCCQACLLTFQTSWCDKNPSLE